MIKRIYLSLKWIILYNLYHLALNDGPYHYIPLLLGICLTFKIDQKISKSFFTLIPFLLDQVLNDRICENKKR